MFLLIKYFVPFIWIIHDN